MLFRQIVGQKELIESLIKAVSLGRIPHAQLFWGPEGNEKLALALAYAQYINCANRLYASQGADLGGLSSDSCGQCPSCRKFEKLVHPDLHFFYPNNINGGSVKKDSQSLDYIDLWRETVLKNEAEFSYNEWIERMDIGNRQAIINIRDCGQILQTLSLKSSEARFRVIVIWMIEKLSPTIASTLLKTLEEPEPQTVFLLVSENTDQILPTILSRTQMVKVPRIENADIERHLSARGVEAETAHRAAEESSGNLITARLRCSHNEIRENFHSSFADWMRLCFRVDMPALVAFSERQSALGRENLKFFFEHCMDEIHACLLMGNHCADRVFADAEEKKFWTNFSKFVTGENIHHYYKIFDDAIFAVGRNAHVPTLITDMSMELCRILAATQQALKRKAGNDAKA